MIRRLFAATAMAVLLATPVLAQTAPPSSPGAPPAELREPGAPGTSEYPPGAFSPGAQSGQMPADCTPNDPRPECQTAELPGESGSSQPGSGSSLTPDQQPGSGSAPTDQPGSSGTPDTGSSGSGSSQ
ncbi:hypothetical protein [Magnetospirillum sp. UT-4]|uniref:hypothetical protein n=1 Tax=Magnetospirillum sp. UT-4 TaxID=2681467 RepID=UPI0015731492|nr:hypothetical protein [Magnetospirillum sp. UT-4]